jgi:hypothetical protein
MPIFVMIDQLHSRSPMPPRFIRVGFYCLTFSIVFLILAGDGSYAQSTNQDFRIGYNDQLLSISAQDADVKRVLTNLADKTNTAVWFPESLEKKISIKIRNVSLKEALERILKDLNHVIIYSGSSKNQAAISKVIVYKKSKLSKQATGRNKRIMDRIRAYERRIESYKNRLTRIDPNSRRGKNYIKQINRLENSIDRLERQLN